MSFTTRPELKGTFGMVASTHWIASAVGMKLLEAGGMAGDAAVGMAFVLNVVEPHLNGPLGDMPALVWPAGDEAPTVLCGQGSAPAGATIAHYRSEGLEIVPGSGLLATVVPGAFDALMLILRDHGRLRLRDVLEPAIHYARSGHPMLPQVSREIAGLAAIFRDEWPTSAPVWLPGGAVPEAGELFANSALAAFWERLLSEAEAAVGGREAEIEAARLAFHEGFVAEAIDRFMAEACVLDATGERRKGVLTGADMAAWRATSEVPISADTHGATVWKCGPWTQGPVLLQALRILETDALGDLDPTGDVFVHLAAEALKLAFADREAYYGDPAYSDIPLETLLSPDYARKRRALISEDASHVQRPGSIVGVEALAAAFLDRAGRATVKDTGIGTGEPTMAHLTNQNRDTVHVDVIDQWGNAVSATPSGGWLKSNPVIPELGVPLNSRAQMFWLDEGLPTSLAPGRRPRTTLSPSMARLGDGTRLAFGTPGGDQQDQWQFAFLLRLLHHGLNLQEAIDAPLFHTAHLQASFFPRGTRPGHLLIEPAAGEETIGRLRARGHAVEVSAPWAAGRLTAASRRPDGLLKAAATPRLMQAYAIGR
ncbi:gamma-glutamyltransferase family protein [Ovoidimarina sediminis]|uniref:gamma-glutamyltransferase family protein n=1 Tax=Ovoidimarina sediminis TaxID=3079856 RepID=UPI00290917A3|nr:gamma-glutamyltransferase family protein [Rhodophyticola sp. MJ-SS7]MDU8945429.1 gamma-glutamyltransferase family protein [Rhodophyticola sp. MJ-SS7]